MKFLFSFIFLALTTFTFASNADVKVSDEVNGLVNQEVNLVLDLGDITGMSPSDIATSIEQLLATELATLTVEEECAIIINARIVTPMLESEFTIEIGATCEFVEEHGEEFRNHIIETFTRLVTLFGGEFIVL